jgi:hypothetical protein
MDYHSGGTVRKGRTYDDFRGSAKYQVFPYEPANKRSVEYFEALDVEALHASLKADVLTRWYQPTKGKAKEWPAVVVQTLTVEDLEAARLRKIKKLNDPAGRRDGYTQALTWDQVSPGVYVRRDDPTVYQIQAWRLPGTYQPHVDCTAERWIPNSTIDSRSNGVIQDSGRTGDIGRFNLDRVQALAAGGERWERGPEGGLWPC